MWMHHISTFWSARLDLGLFVQGLGSAVQYIDIKLSVRKVLPKLIELFSGQEFIKWIVLLADEP